MIENRHQEASPARRIAARRRAARGVIASYTHQSSDRHRNSAGSPAPGGGASREEAEREG